MTSRPIAVAHSSADISTTSRPAPMLTHLRSDDDPRDRTGQLLPAGAVDLTILPGRASAARPEDRPGPTAPPGVPTGDRPGLSGAGAEPVEPVGVGHQRTGRARRLAYRPPPSGNSNSSASTSSHRPWVRPSDALVTGVVRGAQCPRPAEPTAGRPLPECVGSTWFPIPETGHTVNLRW